MKDLDEGQCPYLNNNVKKETSAKTKVSHNNEDIENTDKMMSANLLPVSDDHSKSL